VSFFDYFRKKNAPSSASLAKERLQIIVAHERHRRTQPDFLPKMQQEIIDVIRKYIDIDSDQVVISLDESDHCSVLELNITLPE
jgi:cell division topological specificity factor